MKVQNKKLEHFPFLATVFTGKVYIDPLLHNAPRDKSVVLYKQGKFGISQ